MKIDVLAAECYALKAAIVKLAKKLFSGSHPEMLEKIEVANECGFTQGL